MLQPQGITSSHLASSSPLSRGAPSRASSLKMPDSLTKFPPLIQQRSTAAGRLGNWQLLRKIHEGSCVDVFLARPWGARQCCDYVAKVLHNHRHDDQVARELLANEAAANRAVLHPNLTTVFEAHTRSCPCYLVLPRIEGVTLDVLQREGQCSLRRGLRVVRQTAEALAAMHAAGWRHGDVKPANIMVSPTGHTTLIDLSLAAPRHAPLRGLGTRTYAAPETAQEVGCAASDVYSLGIVLFELLLDASTRANTKAKAPRVPARHLELAQISSSLQQLPIGGGLIRRMLQTEPDDRPRAAEVINELTPLEIQTFSGLGI